MNVPKSEFPISGGSVADTITAIGTFETGLPEARLQGERGRTTGQPRPFETILPGDLR